MFAKVVIAVVKEELVMLCLPAPCSVDLLKLMNAVGTDNVRLAREVDFADAFPDCEVGAMPPFFLPTSDWCWTKGITSKTWRPSISVRKSHRGVCSVCCPVSSGTGRG